MSTMNFRSLSAVRSELSTALSTRNNAMHLFDKSASYETVTAEMEKAEKAFSKLMKEYNRTAMHEFVTACPSALRALLSRTAPALSLSVPEGESLPELQDDTQEISLYSVRESLPENYLYDVIAIARLSAYKASIYRGIAGAEIWLTHDNNGESLPKMVLDRINALGGKGVKSSALSAALHKAIITLSAGELSLGKAAHYYMDFGNVIIRMGKQDCTVRELVSDRAIYRAFTSYVLDAAGVKGLSVDVTPAPDADEVTTETAETAEEETM